MNQRAKSSKKGKLVLSKKGQRVTRQRSLLLNLIREEGHLDANDLYQRAREKQPRLSLSTVYRNLQLFKKLELVAEHDFAELHHHYEAKSKTEHHHLLCLGCGKIVEFRCPLSHRIKAKVSKEHGFEITNAEVRMTGFCPACRQQEAKDH